MNLFKKFSLLALSLAFIVACEETEDLESPEVSINSPSTGAEYTTGDTIAFQATLTDDVELASYSVLINPTFENAPISVWTDTISDNATEKTAEVVEFGIVVPDSVAAGEYSITTRATDEAGSISTDQTVLINVQNASDTEAPLLTITSPNISLPLTLTAGSNFTITGSASDNQALAQIRVEFRNTVDGTVQTVVNEVEGTVADIFETVTAPTSAGIYVVSIIAVDGVNNQTVSELNLTLN